MNDQILPLLICVPICQKRYPPQSVGRDTQGLRTRIFLLACYEQHITHIMQEGFEPWDLFSWGLNTEKKAICQGCSCIVCNFCLCCSGKATHNCMIFWSPFQPVNSDYIVQNYNICLRCDCVSCFTRKSSHWLSKSKLINKHWENEICLSPRPIRMSKSLFFSFT